ncbi:MAG: biotin transporter BioY [Elusimicrobia bacterium]|nr:biotin transporter BioY [Elusimicrobiota bacterium]
MQARAYPTPMQTFAEALMPSSTLTTDALLVAGASLVIALCAQFEIRLPFTPVPITATTLGVLYAGAVLGARRGFAAAVLYLLEGACGLPFFAGGAGGGAWLVGPTGGYLLGFAPAAWVTGALAEQGWDRRPLTAMGMMLAGSSVVFACGMIGLARFFPWPDVPVLGLFPFIPGDLVKSGLSAAFLPLGWKAMRALGFDRPGPL